jgi:hypothetical protein
MFRAKLIPVALLAASCVSAELSPAEKYERARAAVDAEIARCERGETGPDWFPPDFDNSYGRCWYRSALMAMHEQPLWPPKPGVEIYRFTFLPWRNLAQSARVDLTAKVAEAVEMSGNGDTPGEPVHQTHEKVNAQGQIAVRAAVEAEGFWSPDPDEEWPGNDGAQWIVEGVRGGEYHVRKVWSGHIEDRVAFRELCEALVDASGSRMPREPAIVK